MRNETDSQNPQASPHKAAQNILQFGTHLDAITHPPLAEIRRYWDGLRAGRMMPMRSEVDPRDMSPFLEHCFIVDRRSAGDTRFRVAGMCLNELMGMELRGMHIRSIIEPPARPQFSASLEQMFATPEIQDYQLTSTGPQLPDLAARLLILPLKSEDGTVDRAMGCLVTRGIVGIPPRRFTVNAVTRTSLITGVTAQGSLNVATPELVSTSAATGFAESAPLFGGYPEPTASNGNGTPRGAPYLRVVK